MATYAAAVWVGWRDGVHAIPLPAIFLNVTWELLFAFLYPPVGRAKRALYALWFLLDVVILAQALVYWKPSEAVGFLRDWPGTTAVLGLFGSLALHVWLLLRFRRPYHVAFGLNLLMSALFVLMFFDRPDRSGLSLTVAWLKFLGTTAISVANVFRFRGELATEKALVTFMSGSFVSDIVYLALLHGAPTEGSP